LHVFLSRAEIFDHKAKGCVDLVVGPELSVLLVGLSSEACGLNLLGRDILLDVPDLVVKDELELLQLLCLLLELVDLRLVVANFLVFLGDLLLELVDVGPVLEHDSFLLLDLNS